MDSKTSKGHLHIVDVMKFRIYKKKLILYLQKTHPKGTHTAHTMTHKHSYPPNNYNYPVLISVKPAELYNKVFTNLFVISACDAIGN